MEKSGSSTFAKGSRNVGAGDGWASEWTYTLKTLPPGVVRGLADAALRRDRMGLARAGVILAGLAITAAGYFQQTISQGIAKRRQSGDNIAITSHLSNSEPRQSEATSVD